MGKVEGGGHILKSLRLFYSLCCAHTTIKSKACEDLAYRSTLNN